MSRASTDAEQVARFASCRMPDDLPAARQIIEACGRGMATVRVAGSLLAFDYTSRGLRDGDWLEVVSRLRGLVVDPSATGTPVCVWPTPIVEDLSPTSVVPRRPAPVVQEKLDGELVALFEHQGEWRLTGRDGPSERLDGLGAEMWSPSTTTARLDPSTVLYLELCHPSAAVPTRGAPRGLHLLDVIDRRDGSMLEAGDVAETATGLGLPTPPVRPWPGSVRALHLDLVDAGPEKEGYVLRWGARRRARLVNPRYTLLWNLTSEPTAGAVVDLWLSSRAAGPVLDLLPDDVRRAVCGVLSELDLLADRHRGRSRYDVACALLAARGGPESPLEKGR